MSIYHDLKVRVKGSALGSFFSPPSLLSSKIAMLSFVRGRDQIAGHHAYSDGRSDGRANVL